MQAATARVPPRAVRRPETRFSRPFHLALLMLVMGVLLTGGTARGQGLGGGVEGILENDPNQPWQITADEISYDDRARRYVAQGNVRITRGDRRLSADQVRFDQRTMDAEAKGHVVLVAGGDMLIGDQLQINLENQTGTITQGTLFLHENHFYIRGAKIEKLGPREYAIERASFSSCDGERPAWKITGRKLNVEIEGRGVVKHAALWVKDVPVFYTPIFFFPASTKRQSGFLTPELGSSNRQGYQLNVPFFWAINDQSDMTFFNDYMSKRGNKMGAEYRYIVDPFTKGTAMYDYLNDRKIDDGKGNNSRDYGYPDDNYLRRNETRYWFRMKHDQGLPLGFRGRLDLDLVSDQDYLTEFRFGLNGFEETRDYFRDEFGRDLDDFNDPVRTNQAVINKNWYHSVLNGGVIWLDDSTKERDDGVASFDTTLQRLPFILWDAVKQPLGSTPLQLSADTEWTSFYSDENTKGLRFDVHPRVYLPFSLGDYLYVEPSAGLRQTAWFIDRYQNIDADQQQALEDQLGRRLPEEDDKDKSQYRTLYDLMLDVSTELSGVYDLGGPSLDAVRHTVRPRVIYNYIPNDDQDKYPAFISQTEDGEPVALNDQVNRIDPRNLITYSITNTFTSRYRKANPTDQDAEAEIGARDNFKFNDFLRLKFEQSFNIRTARSDRNRPFSPIGAELEFFPRRYLSLKSETAYDTYDQSFVKRDAWLKLESPRGDEFKIDYRYDKRKTDFSGEERLDKNVQSISAGAKVKLPYHLTAYGSSEHDLRDNRRIESVLGFLYEAQCWSLDINYNDSENNGRAIAFQVSLTGLGGLGFSQGVGPEE
jgi:LPS-assembly protein